MASTCPKCHRVLEEDEVCCAQVRYTWRCARCFKLDTGLTIPYGKCFMCGGDVDLIADRDVGDSMRFQAVRDALQFELNFFTIYRRAREKVARPEQRAVLEWLYALALDHLHDLEARYHAHLNSDMVEQASGEDVPVLETSDVADLMRGALSLERRARDHFHELARDFPAGLENDICRELEAEADEDIAFLEAGLEEVV